VAVAGFDDNIRDDAFQALLGYLKESRGGELSAQMCNNVLFYDKMTL
jgi:hypothetical protein